MSNFWEIIPHITKPLAALCFIAGIAYLVIREVVRSNNRRKEQSLKVKDPEAQRIAAEKILQDYPDLNIGPITEEISKVEVAKLIIRSKSTRYNYFLYAFILLAVIFAAAYLVPVLKSTDTSKDESKFLKNKSWAELQAVKTKYPYATLSVVQHVKLRDIMVNGERK